MDFLVYRDGIPARNSKIDRVLNKYKSKILQDLNQVYLSEEEMDNDEEELDEANNSDEMEEEESRAATGHIEYDPSAWENQFYETDEDDSILANYDDPSFSV